MKYFIRTMNTDHICTSIQLLQPRYSRVHISSDTAFLKILKKLSIVQE